MENTEPVSGPVASALLQLVGSFDSLQIRYALIGGLAIGLRSRPRSTRDVDVLLSIPQLQLPALLDDLRQRGFSMDVATVIEGYVRHHITFFDYQGVRIDWLKPMLPLYEHVLDRASDNNGFGTNIRVASAEGLICLKLIASRDQDIVDINSLLAANRGQLDLAWVEQEWRTLFDTNDPRWIKFTSAVREYYEYPRK